MECYRVDHKKIRNTKIIFSLKLCHETAFTFQRNQLPRLKPATLTYKDLLSIHLTIISMCNCTTRGHNSTLTNNLLRQILTTYLKPQDTQIAGRQLVHITVLTFSFYFRSFLASKIFNDLKLIGQVISAFILYFVFFTKPKKVIWCGFSPLIPLIRQASPSNKINHTPTNFNGIIYDLFINLYLIHINSKLHKGRYLSLMMIFLVLEK